MVNGGTSITIDDSLYAKCSCCSVKVSVLNSCSICPSMHNVEGNNLLSSCLVHKASQHDSLINEIPEKVAQNEIIQNDLINVAEVIDNKSFLIAFQNIEGFNQAKLTEFLAFLNDFQPAMLGIAEHWYMFDCDIPKVNHFKLWSRCRKSGKRGGVVLYLDERKVGPSYLLPFPQGERFDDIQQVWVQMPRSKLAIAVVYIPPGDTAARQEQLLAIADFCEISEILNLYPIIMGDFNIHDLEIINVDYLDANMRQEHAFVNDMCRIN